MASQRKSTQILGQFGLQMAMMFVTFFRDGVLCSLPAILDAMSWGSTEGLSFQYHATTYGSIKITDNTSFNCALGSFLFGCFLETWEVGKVTHHIAYYLMNCMDCLERKTTVEHSKVRATCKNDEEFKAMLSEYMGITPEELQRLIHGLEVISKYCTSLNLYRVEFSDELDIVHCNIEEYEDLSAYITHREKRTRRKHTGT